MTDHLGPYLLGPNDTPENGIYVGDARDLAQEIPDRSVGLIFADPPYLRKFLWTYEWLAETAKAKLEHGHFCLAMCGGNYLDQIMIAMSRHLSFFWKYEIELTGWQAGVVWPYGNTSVTIINRSKPLLAYVCGKGLPRTSTMSLFRGTGRDKRYHAWGQDLPSIRYYVDCFSAPGDIIVDPFTGGGTVPTACRMLNRRYIAFEVSADAAETARERVRNAPLLLPMPETTQAEMNLC